MSRLRPEQYADIRRLATTDQLPPKVLSTLYGISTTHVRNILRDSPRPGRTASTVRSTIEAIALNALDATNRPDLANEPLAALAGTTVSFVRKWRVLRGRPRLPAHRS